ncbi:class I SAM-dependent methyltransferase [Tissierella praeacuta]|uniref:class I SAM-dependent methyltransferase n=1 Tax=Tissierella praeacuta TaxID=43131 RepID=UPI0028A67CF0|nr:class I SAM-dependent methyltransferase [Tissierella praeacuta]
MNLKKLKEIWKYEEQYSFKGWDFSHINNRMEEEALPWDYKKIVKSYIRDEKILLDMGTGGGEFLLSLNPAPGKTYVTESYLPNIELCKEILTPYGIEVRPVFDDSHLPFDDDYFDIVINRHESFCLWEINRILKPGGLFITQQVGGMNNREISKFLLGEYPNITDIDLNLDKILQEAKNTGMKIIDTGEYFPKTYFYDIGAFVFYAKIIEWEFPGFSVERCFDKLIELQDKLEKQGHIETLEHRYFLIVEKQ